MFGEPSAAYRRLTAKLRRGIAIERISLALIFRVASEGHHIPSLVAAHSRA